MRRRNGKLVARITGTVIAVGLAWISQGWAFEVWVTNQEDHTVTVIDTQTNTVLDTITPGGKKPHNVAFSPDGAYAFVANVGTNDVNMIETKTRRTIDTFPAGTRAHGPAVTPDGTQLWVANPGSNDVTVI
ncbi:MAG TPA: hypothetical protein VJM10_01585, partial [Candidatus Methylomirabilis sp.]|nr:hypothetical protein [Candidatus Methylomirabilis sp.]